MPKKLDYESVKILIESKGGRLLSPTYTGVHQDLRIQIGDVVETRKLSNIRKTKKLVPKSEQIKGLSDKKREESFEKIKKTLKDHNVDLLDQKYVNDVTPIRLRFPCGTVEKRTWQSIRNSLRKGKGLKPKKTAIKERGEKSRLTLSDIAKDIECRGGKLLSENYEGWDVPLLVETVDGKQEYKKISQIRKWEKLYSKEYRLQQRIKKQQLSYEAVKNIIEAKGGQLLSEEKEYKGVHSPIRVKTKDGCVETRLLSNIQKLETLLSRSSDFELEISTFVKSLGFEVITSDRKLIAPLELDILIPEKNIAIECNGLFWHCDLYKDKNYHLRKTEKVNRKGYSLIHISEYDWEFKKDIVKNLIAIRTGKIDDVIGARKCDVVELNHQDATEFLDSNHLQGGSSQGFMRYGLVHGDELVSVMTFSKPRFSEDYDIELCRFANKIGKSIPGSFSKLLKHFVKNNQFCSMVSYCDIAFFDGSVYKNNGFDFVKRSGPNYKYFKPAERILESRNKYQKHKLDKVLENFDPELSEYENMIANGFLRIWDCGNDVYKYENKYT